MSVLGLASLAPLVGVAGAERTTVQSDLAEMTFGADFSPRKLPGAAREAVALTISGTIRSSRHAYPPALEKLTLGLGGNSSIDGSALPRCEDNQASFSPSLKRLKEICADAIVGGGTIGLGVLFPGEKALPAGSGLVVFNGKAERGRTTLYAIAEIAEPIVTTIVIPIEIMGRPGSRGGTQMTLVVPKIAGGAGFISDFRVRLRRRLGGPARAHGVAALACPGERLLVKARAKFSEGPPIRTELSLACRRNDAAG